MHFFFSFYLDFSVHFFRLRVTAKKISQKFLIQFWRVLIGFSLLVPEWGLKIIFRKFERNQKSPISIFPTSQRNLKLTIISHPKTRIGNRYIVILFVTDPNTLWKHNIMAAKDTIHATLEERKSTENTWFCLCFDISCSGVVVKRKTKQFYKPSKNQLPFSINKLSIWWEKFRKISKNF